LNQARASEDLIKRIPTAIKTFEEAFHSLEPRQQKAQLQTILKATHIYKDGKIELEFRDKLPNHAQKISYGSFLFPEVGEVTGNIEIKKTPLF